LQIRSSILRPDDITERSHCFQRRFLTSGAQNVLNYSELVVRVNILQESRRLYLAKLAIFPHI
jgi:hypothetical protein